MRTDLIKPIFTAFFKDKMQIDVIVEEIEGINPVFTVSTYEDRRKKHLLIIYVNARKGALPILNIYHYDDDSRYLLSTIVHAHQSEEHYNKVRGIFESIHKKLGVFNIKRFEDKNSILQFFTSYSMNTVDNFKKLSGSTIAEFTSGIGTSSIRPCYSFTIYEEELHLDFRFIYSVDYTDKIISSHPQLLANNPNYYADIEKELYNTSRKTIIAKVRQKLHIVLDPLSITDEDLARYVNLLEMQKI